DRQEDQPCDLRLALHGRKSCCRLTHGIHEREKNHSKEEEVEGQLYELDHGSSLTCEARFRRWPRGHEKGPGGFPALSAEVFDQDNGTAVSACAPFGPCTIVNSTR